MNEFVNEKEIRKTIAIMKPDNQLFEIRICTDSKKKVYSGYFKDAETLLEALKTVNLRNTNIYMTLNYVSEGCFSRSQSETLRTDYGQTTSDNDIYGYQWMLVDVDPERITGVSSTQAELNAAKEMARKVYAYLKDLGFEEPVKAMSGNGCHLLYKISLKNTKENSELIHNCLEALSNIFSNETAKIDTVNYNPARICKLHGTLAQKGANTTERPFRMSRIFTNELDVKVTSIEYLRKLADQLPVKPKVEKQKTYQYDEFDVEDFMRKYGLTYYDTKPIINGTAYYLDKCPFDGTHQHGDARIFRYNDGALAFKCHHNSCRNYKWQDVRLMFEPDAYDRNDTDRKYDEGWQQHNRDKKESMISPIVSDAEDLKAFRTASEIMNDDEPDPEYVRSGINVVDTMMHGLQKQALSVISGVRGSGKSTIVGQIILKAIDDGNTAVVYSGELANKKFTRWILRQAASKQHLEVSTQHDKAVGIPNHIQNKIVGWMDNKYWLYNNKCGNNFVLIYKRIEEAIQEHKADICIIDNLMALDLSEVDKDKYEAQTKFVWKLKMLAERTNTHIIFVAHPRKQNGFLRLNDISGSGNIANIVDNAFLIHRWNRDFELGYNDTFKRDPTSDIAACTNVVEIAKDREDGNQDVFIPLYYEGITKRLRNDPAENITYGWALEDGFETIDDLDTIPF